MKHLYVMMPYDTFLYIFPNLDLKEFLYENDFKSSCGKEKAPVVRFTLPLQRCAWSRESSNTPGLDLQKRAIFALLTSALSSDL